MKRIIYILLISSLANVGIAQETYRHQTSSVPDTSRFEIIQSELGARLTFKIDKYFGVVYLLVEDEPDLHWQSMKILDHPQDGGNVNYVNYQLFVSGLGARFTFLLNVITGATWQLTEDTESGQLFWLPLE